MLKQRWIAGAIVAFLGIPAVPGADTQYLRCESGRFGRYRECRVDTDGRVELVRELSRRRCVQWRSWGYSRNLVWVDDGCRAEFRVGKDGGGIGAGGAAIIAGVAGAAIIGAIIANKGDHKDERLGAPDWARGRFGGFSPRMETDFNIKIERNGNVTGTANKDAITGHFTAADGLHLGDVEFDVVREAYGFRATQKNDRENVIYFRSQ